MLRPGNTEALLLETLVHVCPESTWIVEKVQYWLMEYWKPRLDIAEDINRHVISAGLLVSQLDTELGLRVKLVNAHASCWTLHVYV